MVEYYYSGYGILLNSIDNSNINLSNINSFRYRRYYVEGNDLSVYVSSFSTPTGVPQFGEVIHTRSGSYYMSDHSATIALLDLLFNGKI